MLGTGPRTPGGAVGRYVLLTGVERPLLFSVPRGAPLKGPKGLLCRVTGTLQLQGSETLRLPALQGCCWHCSGLSLLACTGRCSKNTPSHSPDTPFGSTHARPRLAAVARQTDTRPPRSTTKQARRGDAKTRSWYTRPALSAHVMSCLLPSPPLAQSSVGRVLVSTTRV